MRLHTTSRKPPPKKTPSDTVGNLIVERINAAFMRDEEIHCIVLSRQEYRTFCDEWLTTLRNTGIPTHFQGYPIYLQP